MSRAFFKKLIFFCLIALGAKSAYSATNVYITNQTGDSVSVVDLLHHQKLTDISLPALAGPTSVISTPDGRYLISANYHGGWSGSISLIDTSNYKTRELKFGDDFYSWVARGPAGIALSKDGTRLFVSAIGYFYSPTGASSLAVVDLSELQKPKADLETVSLPFSAMEIEGGGGSGIVFDSERQLVYMAQYGFFDGDLNFLPTNLVSIIDFSKVTEVTDLSKAHVTQISSANYFIGPVSLVLNNNNLYVANQGPIPEGGGASSITVVKNIDSLDLSKDFIDLDQNGSTGIEMKEITVTPWPTGMTFFNNKLYVTSFNEPQWGSSVITLIDDPSGNPQVLKIINAIDEPTDKFYDGLKARSRIYQIGVSVDGKKILVAGQPWYVDKEDPEKLGSLYMIDSSMSQSVASGLVDLEGQKGKGVKKIEAGGGSNGLTIATDIPLTLDLPKELNFTTKVNSPTHPQKIIIKNNSQIVLHLLKISNELDVFALAKESNCKDQLIAGESCDLYVTFDPGTFKTFHGSLTFTTNADNGDENGNLVVKLTGIAVDEGGASPLTDPGKDPGAIAFLPSAEGGGCYIGKSVSQTSLFLQVGFFLLVLSTLMLFRKCQKNDR